MIVRKNVQDAVPKAIMCFLVNYVRVCFFFCFTPTLFFFMEMNAITVCMITSGLKFIAMLKIKEDFVVLEKFHSNKYIAYVYHLYSICHIYSVV